MHFDSCVYLHMDMKRVHLTTLLNSYKSWQRLDDRLERSDIGYNLICSDFTKTYCKLNDG